MMVNNDADTVRICIDCATNAINTIAWAASQIVKSQPPPEVPIRRPGRLVLP